MRLEQAAFKPMILPSGSNALSAIVDGKIGHVFLSPEILVIHLILVAENC